MDNYPDTGGGEDNCFGLTHPKNESVGFLQLLFEFSFGTLSSI